ncbi:MAG TPA: alpha/beta hydrolase [Clostridiaceae bacterium]|nr:alpha/beta hydrolase [Clostridiaceae bacterium]
MRKKRKLKLLPLLSFILAIFLIAVVALGIFSFMRADRMLNLEPTPLEPFATNIIGNHQNVSFRSSGDQIVHYGWWLPQSTHDLAKGTIVLIHDRGQNRLQFGLDTATLYDYFTSHGFNVLAFDQRGSGESSSALHAYGYNAYEDVFAALRYAKTRTSAPLILMGFGAGNSAIWHAWDALPSKIDLDEDAQNAESITLTRSDISAVIMDTPVMSTEDCIVADIAATELPAQWFFQWSIPLAMRLSAGNSPGISFLNSMLDAPFPIFLTRSQEDTVYPKENTDVVFSEIERLRPATSTIFETPGTGHINGWVDYQGSYKEELSLFLERWFGH